MSDGDGTLELYQMIAATCNALDVLMTVPEIDRHLGSGDLTTAAHDVLNEYAALRRYMLAGSTAGSKRDV